MESLPDFSFALWTSPEAITHETQFIQQSLVDVVQAISQLPPKQRTFSSTFQRFHQACIPATQWTCRVVLGSMVHEVKSYRDAFQLGKDQMRQLWERVYTDATLFSVLQSVQEDLSSVDCEEAPTNVVSSQKAPAKDDHWIRVDHPRRALHWTEQRYIEKVMLIFRRNGVDLSAGDRSKLGGLRKEIGLLESQFQRALGEDDTRLEFSRDDLAGCSESFLASLPVTSENPLRYSVMARAPHLPVVLDSCQVANTRKLLLTAANSRCAEANAIVLEKLLSTRHQAAQLLGYSSWAEYRLAGNMAHSVSNVESFLDHIQQKLTDRLAHDKKQLLEAKQKEEERLGLPHHNDTLQLWDIGYAEKVYIKQHFQLDERKVKEYFPLDWVLGRVFGIYQTLFSLRFENLDGSKYGWHPDVKFYAIYNNYEEEDTVEAESTSEPPSSIPLPSNKGLVGYFFLDLFARSGKYSHQCVIPLSPSYRDAEGVFHPPVAGNISNLTAPAPNVPALLSHSEVRTFFHEFGHVVHCVCTRSPFVNMSWSWDAVSYPAGVELDFLEVPSQALENWVWEEKTLEILSGHYTDRDQHGNPTPLPREWMAKLKQSRMVFSGYKYMRQIFMTLYDLRIHSLEKPPTKQQLKTLWDDLQSSLVGVGMIPGTFPPSSWYHLAMGYDAGYYSYLWSEVVSHDFYRTKFLPLDDVLDPTMGKRYRDQVLSPGALVSGEAMTENFLGRAVSEQAFLDAIGI